MPHLDLSDDEAAALMKELRETVDNDRYQLSPRIRTLRGLLAKLRPEPVREPMPPPPALRAAEQGDGMGDGGSHGS
jgi:hypothetical protein